MVVKALAVAIVNLIGLLTVFVPVIALILGLKARVASKAMSTGGSGLATAAVVIAACVTAGAVAAQVYMVFTAAGACSLEGC